MRESAGRSVTCNLDALLLENETLRHQVRLLREELALLQSRGEWREPPRHRQDGRRHPAAEDPFARPPGRGERVRSWRSGPEVTTGAAPGITPQLVRQWGEALARHPRWRELRLGSRLEGDPAAGGSLEFGLRQLQCSHRSGMHAIKARRVVQHGGVAALLHIGQDVGCALLDLRIRLGRPVQPRLELGLKAGAGSG